MPFDSQDLQWLMFAGGQSEGTVATLDERAEALSSFAVSGVAKHASHDQSTHGNWADGSGSGGGVRIPPQSEWKTRGSGGVYDDGLTRTERNQALQEGLAARFEGTALTAVHTENGKVTIKGIPGLDGDMSVKLKYHGPGSLQESDIEAIAAGAQQMRTLATEYPAGRPDSLTFSARRNSNTAPFGGDPSSAAYIAHYRESGENHMVVQTSNVILAVNKARRVPNPKTSLPLDGSPSLAEATRRVVTHETGHVIDFNTKDSPAGTSLNLKAESARVTQSNAMKTQLTEKNIPFGKGSDIGVAVRSGLTPPPIGFYGLSNTAEFIAESFTAKVHGIDIGANLIGRLLAGAGSMTGTLFPILNTGNV